MPVSVAVAVSVDPVAGTEVEVSVREEDGGRVGEVDMDCCVSD